MILMYFLGIFLRICFSECFTLYFVDTGQLNCNGRKRVALRGCLYHG